MMLDTVMDGDFKEVFIGTPTQTVQYLRKNSLQEAKDFVVCPGQTRMLISVEEYLRKDKFMKIIHLSYEAARDRSSAERNSLEILKILGTE